MRPPVEIDVEYVQGIHVVDSILWMDAPRRTDLCFLSHAHVEPLDSHRKILATKATAVLVRDRMRGVEMLTTPFQRRFAIGDLELELHPSGHMLGSAQILVDRGGARLVYTGDFQLAASRTSQAGQVLPCDVLILQATYGRTRDRFPPKESAERALVDWARATLGSGDQPVLLASALGKAQELACLLAEHGLKACAQDTVHSFCREYARLGVRMPPVRRFRGGLRPGEVLLVPPGLRDSRAVARLERPRFAAVTGRALDPGVLQRERLDESFCLSAHADHGDLRRYAEESGAHKIFLVGPSAGPLAAELRSAGHDAWPLRPPEQMELFQAGRIAASS